MIIIIIYCLFSASIKGLFQHQANIRICIYYIIVVVKYNLVGIYTYVYMYLEGNSYLVCRNVVNSEVSCSCIGT